MPELKSRQARRHDVYIGGPVATGQVLLLMKNRSKGAGIHFVSRNLGFSFELDVLEDVLARGTDPSDVRVYAGHAGWMAGQLENEIERRVWNVVRSDHSMIFGPDDGLWEKLIESLEPPGIRI